MAKGVELEHVKVVLNQAGADEERRGGGRVLRMR